MTLEDSGYYHMLLAYTADMEGEPYSLFLLETGTYEINGSRIVLTSDYGDESEGTVRDGEVSVQMTIAERKPSRICSAGSGIQFRGQGDECR